MASIAPITPKDDAAAAAEAQARLAAAKFRRASVSLGIAAPSTLPDMMSQGQVASSSMRNRYVKGTKWYSEVDQKLVTESFLEFTALDGHVSENVYTWYENVMPDPTSGIDPVELAEYHRSLFQEIAGRVKPLLKLSRIGLTLRIFFCLCLSFCRSFSRNTVSTRPL